MFTGIIEEIGTILRCEPAGLVIQATQMLQGIETKDSIAVDGACLTVTGRGEDWFRVDVMPETFRCTRLGSLQPGSHVNLERALLSDGRIGGHLVQGHVDLCHPKVFYCGQWCQSDGDRASAVQLFACPDSLYKTTYQPWRDTVGHIAQPGDRYHRKVRSTSSGTDRQRSAREWERERRDRRPRYR